MESKSKTLKTKSKSKSKSKSDEEEMGMEIESEPRVVLTPLRGHSRTSSVSSNMTDDLSRPGTSGLTKRRKVATERDIDKEDDLEDLGGGCLQAVADERKDLERFLFDESNKVSRQAIKHILEKWAVMETRLQNVLVENEILKERNRRTELSTMGTISYAQAAAARKHEPRPLGTADPKKVPSPPREKFEVVLVKPEKEDRRNNEQIKEDVLKKLEGVRRNLKVRNIRQMRKQGLVIEVKDNSDVETIKRCNLDKVGLVVERPRKIHPSIIVYDIEKDYKEEELKEELIRKNLGEVSESEFAELTNEIKFVHNFKVKDANRVNWIIQLPAKFYTNILNKGRVFMMWRSYRTKEFVNITRCYKCHGYGHIAKFCNSPDQLCSMCGSKEHLRNDCPKKNSPECVNCVRAKRRDTKHEVHNRECPEYKRQLELYNNKIQWL